MDGIDGKIVVTAKEALQLLGVRSQSLPSLERLAGMSSRSRRGGFTAPEIKRLLKVLTQAVSDTTR